MQRPKAGKDYVFVRVEDGTLVEFARFRRDESDPRGSLQYAFRDIGFDVIDERPWEEQWGELWTSGFTPEQEAKRTGLLPTEWTTPPDEGEAVAQAERLARKELAGWTLGKVARFEARNVNSRWMFAYGDEMRPPGKRARGLQRRSGWAVWYDIPETPDVVYTPSIAVVHVFDDGTVELAS